LSEQILRDGVHFERSPMYQALVLEGFLDVMNVLERPDPLYERLEPAVHRMCDALRAMTHPDGGIALLNDATLEIAVPTATLCDHARRIVGYEPETDPPRQFPDAGYYTFRDQKIFLIVDAAPPGPDYLMAHAHADIFSYELSVRSRRIVVDPGVFEYASGPMRDYVRSTRAHSTVTVDDLDQIECWSSFRVGRRAKPQDVVASTDNGTWSVSGAFRGYGTLIGDEIVHTREISVDPAAGTMSVSDRVTGRGCHAVASRIHLHPDVVVSGDTDPVLRRGDVSCLLTANGAAFNREQGWYCPEFGTRIQTTVLVLEKTAALPVTLRYTFHFEAETASPEP
jgi:uncharacterized heparinase superfamily protein